MTIKEADEEYIIKEEIEFLGKPVGERFIEPEMQVAGYENMKVELTAPTTQQDLAKVEEDMYLIPFIKQELKGFNLGESLAREDERHKIIELIKQKLQFCYSHKEIVKEILKSLSEDVEHD